MAVNLIVKLKVMIRVETLTKLTRISSLVRKVTLLKSTILMSPQRIRMILEHQEEPNPVKLVTHRVAIQIPNPKRRIKKKRKNRRKLAAQNQR